ncbi:hypothetical protein [Actinomadura chokoriensis]
MTDIRALIAGCLARERGGADAAARRRMIEVISEGLRTRS